MILMISASVLSHSYAIAFSMMLRINLATWFYSPPPGQQFSRSQAARLAQIAVLARSNRMTVFGILPQMDFGISMLSPDGCR